MFERREFAENRGVGGSAESFLELCHSGDLVLAQKGYELAGGVLFWPHNARVSPPEADCNHYFRMSSQHSRSRSSPFSASICAVRPQAP